MGTTKYTLYFDDPNGNRIKVKDGLNSTQEIFDFVTRDKDGRVPGFVSFYTRVNGLFGEDEELLIDFGRHDCFYVAVKEQDEED